MSFDWGAFITVAEELLDTDRRTDAPEASIRTAISRSYYGAFGIASDRLAARQLGPPASSPHRWVRIALSRSSETAERKAARDLARLWDYRVDADYRDDPPDRMDRQRGKLALEIGRRVIDTLHEGGS